VAAPKPACPDKRELLLDIELSRRKSFSETNDHCTRGCTSRAARQHLRRINLYLTVAFVVLSAAE
jgi:hypothetical protein